MAVQRRPGWWYPYIFVAGFLVVLMVNFTMAYMATSTFSGLATERPYEKGLDYNRTLDAARKQDELGWTAESKVEPGADHGAHVTVTFRDRNGHAVEGLAVSALFVRPTAKGFDREVAMTRVSPGAYATHQTLPLEGVWDLSINARATDGATFGLSRRILVP